MEDKKYNFTLIISQYYYSRHFFIVKHNDDFVEKARAFSIELMKYKRDSDCDRELYLGDLDPEYVGTKIRTRYNINDYGDIYFLQSDYTNYLMGESWGYKDDSRRESREFQKKSVKEAINKHHDYRKIKEIVEKYFEIT